MTWPWSTSPTPQTPEHRLIQIEQKLDWLIQAMLLIGPGLREQLPMEMLRTRPPLPSNYRKRGASDVWQAARYARPEDHASARTSPAPDPSLNAQPVAPYPGPAPSVNAPTAPAPET